MAVKKRVFQVAREFSISNEALIEFLIRLGFDIRNHMSPVSEEMLEKVSAKYAVAEEPVEKKGSDYEFRKQLKDRQVKEKEASEKTRLQLQEKLRVASELAEEKPRILKKRQEEKTAKAAQPTVVEEPPEQKKIRAEKGKVAEKEVVVEEKLEKPRLKPKRKLKIIEIPPEGQEKPRREREVGEKPPVTVEPAEEAKEIAKKEPGKEAATPEGEKKKAKGRRRKGHLKKTEEEEQVLPAKTKKDKKKRKKKARPQFDEHEIQESIRATMQSIAEAGRGKRKKRRADVGEVEEVEEKLKIRVSEFMSLSELAKLMNVEATELIRKCMEMGMMVTINQRLDMDTITLLADEYNCEVEALSEFGEDILEELYEEDEPDKIVPRPPVVTIMGHVDHGKTSLLDYIRESNIIAGEAGGITQHIGAYEVSVNGKEITFLDTPGHEAFTAMRARGAQVTDIVVLVVAADDSVMPQTIEAISHAKAANVPIVVAINKIDKPSANPDLIRQQLADHGVLVEKWGGKYQSAELSAKTGQNVDQLLELLLLEAELLDLKANPNRKAKGVVIESRLDKGKGVVATLLVQTGTLRVGDPFIAGAHSGKVRSLLDERNKRKKEAGPSSPVQILGFNGSPQAGDSFMVLHSERDTREISQKRQQLQREHEHWRSRPRTLDEISRQIKQGQVRHLSVVLKADVDGSLEAIADSLQKLATDEVAVSVIHKGVGAITESDVLLATASEAIIIGFHVRPSVKARNLAEREKVDIRSYNVIYDIIDDVKAALEGFLEPTITEKNVGTAEVRETFKVPKVGLIAGSYVVSGRINRGDKIKIYREDRLIHEGTLSSLKRFKDDVKEVAAGFECGIGIERYNDIKVNDIIEAYELIEEKRKL
ncbi:translation initiation factor IF-2 [candidate division KSB1 bacterium]|nr:translation initiation factor IF-2 [candidate division KSB1 bacterium]RQW05504.1 MAG: translation initiation factor IF-2 [candidate division KSB1 bacterium]